MPYNFIIDTVINTEFENDYIAIIEKFSKNNLNKKLTITNYVRKTNNKGTPKITLDNFHKFSVLPRLENNNSTLDNVFISGAPGSGKSVWANNFAKLYLKIHPKRTVFFFSIPINEHDESITVPKEYINIEEFVELIKEGTVDHTKFKDALLIFDDIKMENPKLVSLVWKYIDKANETYRKQGSTILVISHLATNYTQTRSVIACSAKYVFFNRSLIDRSNRVLSTYYKLDKKFISKVLETKSRWICIDSNNSLIITENEIYNIPLT